MEFCLAKINEAVYNKDFQNEILSLVIKINETIILDENFVCEIEELVKNKEADNFNFDERFIEILKRNIKEFLVCDQIFKKFEREFYDLDKTTIKFAIHFEEEKSKGFLKEIEKIDFVKAKYNFKKKFYL